MCVGTLVENFQHGLVSYRKAFWFLCVWVVVQ
jgi:hypothetical protein